jgi:hypothetical protein
LISPRPLTDAPQSPALVWSEWLPLDEPFPRDVPPSAAGLYRIRAAGESSLAYVGQTGRSLRGRLGSLRAIYGAQMPYRDPHTAAPALWAWLQIANLSLQVGTCTVTEPTPYRKALEAFVIAQHRQRHGASPRWNFGRMPRGFRMSSANNTALAAAGKVFRGGPCEDLLPNHEPGIGPLAPLDSDVEGLAWCGHAWSDWRPLTREKIVRIDRSTGLYRLRGGVPGLVYIGEGSIADRLAAHATKLNTQTRQGRALRAAAPLEFSIAADESWLPHQRQDVINPSIAEVRQSRRLIPDERRGPRTHPLLHIRMGSTGVPTIPTERKPGRPKDCRPLAAGGNSVGQECRPRYPKPRCRASSC